MQKNDQRRVGRTVGSLLLSAAALWTASAAASPSLAEKDFSLPLALVRYEMDSFLAHDLPSLPASLALYELPLLHGGVAAVWSNELQSLPSGADDNENHEGTQINVSPDPAGTVTDNGVPARTLRPSETTGYTVFGDVYINNGSACALDSSMLTGAPAAVYGDTPQVLIVHTHGSEAYTMPAGEEYEPTDNHRTLEKAKSVVRVGDEIAEVLAQRGIGVLHDRELYDYPGYSGAYNRSLASIETYLAQYPSITYVLDVHRDAVEDAQGREYKLLCAEEPNAAQMEFVIGTNGGGAKHEQWCENLKLACAIQQNLLDRYPTLMRPITVRNSRYNQHMTAGSLLLEVGTAGNSLEEALVSARLFADGFAATILPSS